MTIQLRAFSGRYFRQNNQEFLSTLLAQKKKPRIKRNSSSIGSIKTIYPALTKRATTFTWGSLFFPTKNGVRLKERYNLTKSKFTILL